jgi:hypothetical protein
MQTCKDTPKETQPQQPSGKGLDDAICSLSSFIGFAATKDFRKRIIAARPDLKARAPMVEKLMAERNRAQAHSIRQHARIKELESVIRETILENLHLADGDVCTLKRLKDAIGFDLDSPENAQGEAQPPAK